MAEQKKETKLKFRANWKIEGLRKEPVVANQVVELNPEDAVALVECGALSQVEG